MKIAITGAAGFLGRALIQKLVPRHDVYPSDLEASAGDPAITQADVLDIEQMHNLCAGMDRVIHLSCVSYQDNLSGEDNDTCTLDTRLKGTHNVMKVALEAGVQNVIQISDLCIFSGYDSDLLILEDFLPLPDTSAIQQSIYLSEWIAREFARLKPGFVLTLRLGQLVDAKTLSPDTPFNPDWLDLNDAADAIMRGLEIETYDHPDHWGLYNLASMHPLSRFSLAKIRSGRYNFQPAEDFRQWWRGEVNA